MGILFLVTLLFSLDGVDGAMVKSIMQLAPKLLVPGDKFAFQQMIQKQSIFMQAVQNRQQMLDKICPVFKLGVDIMPLVKEAETVSGRSQADKEKMKRIMIEVMETRKATYDSCPATKGIGKISRGAYVDLEKEIVDGIQADESLEAKDKATLAVNARNWLKEEFREKLTDKDVTSVLYKRDEVTYGDKYGLTPEKVQEKEFKKWKEENKIDATKKWGDITLEQKYEVFDRMVGSSGRSNPDVDASQGVKKDPKSRLSRSQSAPSVLKHKLDRHEVLVGDTLDLPGFTAFTTRITLIGVVLALFLVALFLVAPNCFEKSSTSYNLLDGTLDV